jgi:hypothetical protein
MQNFSFSGDIYPTKYRLQYVVSDIIYKKEQQYFCDFLQLIQISLHLQNWSIISMHNLPCHNLIL